MVVSFEHAPVPMHTHSCCTHLRTKRWKNQEGLIQLSTQGKNYFQKTLSTHTQRCITYVVEKKFFTHLSVPHSPRYPRLFFLTCARPKIFLLRFGFSSTGQLWQYQPARVVPNQNLRWEEKRALAVNVWKSLLTFSVTKSIQQIVAQIWQKVAPLNWLLTFYKPECSVW